MENMRYFIRGSDHSNSPIRGVDDTERKEDARTRVYTPKIGKRTHGLVGRVSGEYDMNSSFMSIDNDDCNKENLHNSGGNQDNLGHRRKRAARRVSVEMSGVRVSKKARIELNTPASSKRLASNKILGRNSARKTSRRLSRGSQDTGSSRGAKTPRKMKSSQICAEWKAKGNEFYAKKDYENAVKAYSRAIEYEDSNYTCLANRAAAKFMLGSLRDCYIDCEKALLINKDYSKARIRASRALLSMGLVEEARKHFRLLSDDLNDIQRQEKEDLSSKCEQFGQLLDDADRSLVAENPKGCAEYISKCQSIAPQSLRVLVLQQAVSLLEAQAMAQTTRNINEEVKKKMRDAMMFAELEIEKEELYKSLYHYGKALLFCALTTEARMLFALALEVKPSDPKARQRITVAELMEVYIRRSQVAHEAGDFDKCINYLNSALDIYPDNNAYNGRIHFRRAAAYAAIQRYDEAIKECEKTLAKIPTYYKALLRKAHILIKKGDKQEALKELREAYKKNPIPAVLRELKVVEENVESQQTRNKAKTETPTTNATSSPARRTYYTRSSVKKNHKRISRESLDTLESLDHYKVLGVSRKSTIASIKKAYRKKALKYHPDKRKTPTAERKFQRISEAYDTLKSPGKRSKFDRHSAVRFNATYCY